MLIDLIQYTHSMCFSRTRLPIHKVRAVEAFQNVFDQRETRSLENLHLRCFLAKNAPELESPTILVTSLVQRHSPFIRMNIDAALQRLLLHQSLRCFLSVSLKLQPCLLYFKVEWWSHPHKYLHIF